jgi:hypothetical protein
MKKRIAETVDFFVKLAVGVIVLAVMCVYRAWAFVFGENMFRSLTKSEG